MLNCPFCNNQLSVITLDPLSINLANVHSFYDGDKTITILCHEYSLSCNCSNQYNLYFERENKLSVECFKLTLNQDVLITNYLNYQTAIIEPYQNKHAIVKDKTLLRINQYIPYNANKDKLKAYIIMY